MASLDGPAKQYKLASVGTVTVVEVVKPAESALSEREVVTIQPLDQSIRVYFGDGSSTPNAATVAADGFLHYKHAKETYVVADSQPLFILAENSTTDVIVAERA